MERLRVSKEEQEPDSDSGDEEETSDKPLPIWIPKTKKRKPFINKYGFEEFD